MLEKKTSVIQNSFEHISQSDSVQLQHNYSDYTVIKAGISPEIFYTKHSYCTAS